MIQLQLAIEKEKLENRLQKLQISVAVTELQKKVAKLEN
jgi:hypothetical protein